MSEVEEKLDVKGQEGEQGSEQQSEGGAPQDASSEKAKAKGGSWYTKPGEYGNKAGETIQGTLGKVGEPVGKGLQAGAKPVGSVVDPILGGVMRSGEIMNDAPSHGEGIEAQIREKVGNLLGQGQKAMKSGQAQEYMKKAQEVVESQGGNMDEVVGKAKEVAQESGEGGNEALNQAQNTLKQSAVKGQEGGQDALKQGEQTLKQSEQKLGDLKGQAGKKEE